MRVRPAALLPFALIACCHAALAQEAATRPRQPTPEQVQQLVQSSMRSSVNALLEIAGPMAETVLNVQMAVAAKPETAEHIAAFKRNLFNALTAKGFTPEQALQIVVATSPPAAAIAAK